MNIVAVAIRLCKAGRCWSDMDEGGASPPLDMEGSLQLALRREVRLLRSSSVAATRVGSRVAMWPSPLAPRANGFSRGLERFELLDLVG